MNTQIRFGMFFILIGWLALGMAGCQAARPSGENPTGAPTAPQPTETPVEVFPTETPAATLTASPTPSPTPTATPAWTPAPTLSKNQGYALVRELLEDNGGCRLPCWWGMTPGVTNWNEARHFLETFITEIGQGGEKTIVQNETEMQSTNYGIHYQRNDGQGGFLVMVEGEMITGFISGDKTQKHYVLSQLLTDYGLPEMYL